jgi:hypothetical protein
MGRSVRGEKDYSVIVVTGADITRTVRDKRSRKFLSPQMSAQIEIGLEIAAMANEDLQDGDEPIRAFYKLLKQCLNRDADWKAFYAQEMARVKPAGVREHILNTYSMELAAEKLYLRGDYVAATKKLQDFLDASELEQAERGWYIQEMARYNFAANRAESERLQLAAHRANRFLLKPRNGIAVEKLTVVSQKRMERIASWIGRFEGYSQLDIALTDILGSLVFGTKAERFEKALFELGEAIGFGSERPDKEWKAGPDNLWVLDDKHHIIWECKSEVQLSRAEINKHETEQMNSSADWFEKVYKTEDVRRILIHPTNKVAKSGAFRYEVEVMRERDLVTFANKIRAFFKEFETLEFLDLSTSHIQRLVNAHKLSVSEILTNHTKKALHLQS